MEDEKFIIKDNQIIKKSNGEAIPEDEPIFILRARDRLALDTLLYYKVKSLTDNDVKDNLYHFDFLDRAIQKFDGYRQSHLIKAPSITKGK